MRNDVSSIRSMRAQDSNARKAGIPRISGTGHARSPARQYGSCNKGSWKSESPFRCWPARPLVHADNPIRMQSAALHAGLGGQPNMQAGPSLRGGLRPGCTDFGGYQEPEQLGREPNSRRVPTPPIQVLASCARRRGVGRLHTRWSGNYLP